jgi:hypothetical protein
MVIHWMILMNGVAGVMLLLESSLAVRVIVAGFVIIARATILVTASSSLALLFG